MVIADSSVWISFQRDPQSSIGREMVSLLRSNKVTMVGPVMTEILRGARSDNEFEFFKDRFLSLGYLDTDRETWVRASELGMRLMHQGSQMGFADLIISALSLRHQIPLFTLDQDFQRIPELELHQPHQQG